MGSKNANSKNHNDKNKRKMKKKDKEEDNSNSNPSPPIHHDNVVTDPRFLRAQTDPRFREAPKRETKVAIDSRFDRMFTDKSFLSSSAPIDKRGKPKNGPTSQLASLRHYYKIDEEGQEKVEQSSDEDEEEEEEEGLVKSNCVKPENDDEGTESEESSESESAMDTDTDTDTGTDDEVYDQEKPDMQVLFFISDFEHYTATENSECQRVI